MARRKRRRKSGLATYIIVFISTCIIGFAGYSLLSSLLVRTAVIETGNMGNQYRAQAVIVRDETLTDAEGLTSVSYAAGEGEMVIKGSKIADVYAAGYSQSDMNKLLSVRSRIKTQMQTLLASDYNDAQLDRLDGQALDYAREIGLLVSGKARGNLVNLEEQLAKSLTRRQEYLRSKYYNTDPNLAEVYDEETTLIKKIQSWTTAYLADRDCIVSFYTDGWENVLSLDTFDEVSASLVQSILAGEDPPLSSSQRGRTAVFRKVNPSGWHVLLLSQDKNWNPVIGQTYKVQLAGFDDHIVDGEVTSFTRSGNEILVRMRVYGDMRPVLNVRTSQAEVGEQYVSGLKVPLNALYRQDGQLGVVLSSGSSGTFVPVEEIIRDHEYAVIRSLVAGALMEGQKVRLF